MNDSSPTTADERVTTPENATARASTRAEAETAAMMSDNNKPSAAASTVETIPAELRARRQWVLWRWGERDGKPTKIPVNARSGAQAQSTNPATWAPYDLAARAVGKFQTEGIGYVFAADDPYCGIDLDHCRDIETGTIEPRALDIIEAMNSYTELSPSRTGVHIIIKGQVPAGGNRKDRLEMYSTGRYFTMTGERVDGAPATIEDRQAELDALHARTFADRKAKPSTNGSQPTTTPSVSDTELIAKAKSAKNGAAFSALWSGDTSGYHSSSEADLALCSMLAFWTGNDPRRIDTLFRASGLHREKLSRADYRARTITAAINGTHETYRERRTDGDASEKQGDPSAKKTSPLYQHGACGISYLKKTKDGDAPTYVSNFTAALAEVVRRDDGSGEPQLHYVIIGSRADRCYPAVTVQAAQFTSLRWLDQWGPSARVYVGNLSRDHIINAIKEKSEATAIERTVYCHTGWRRIGDQWVYLHAGGAVGADAAVDVDLAKELTRYTIPDLKDRKDLCSAIGGAPWHFSMSHLRPSPSRCWRSCTLRH